jgi:hypothetical protein
VRNSGLALMAMDIVRFGAVLPEHVQGKNNWRRAA